MAKNEVLEEFPVWALQPRIETGAAAFLNKYPDYDGRGTVIAILDSGIDPGAGGLQVTSDGKPKIIESIDASGSGDVNMTKFAEAVDSKIVGLTGKTLTLTEGIVNANVDGNKFRVGKKRLFSLYPKVLEDRMQKERIERLWDPDQKKNVAKVTNNIEAFEAAKSGEVVTGIDKLAKDNLDAGLDLLMQMDKKMKTNNGLSSSLSGADADVGPTFDVVSYFDGEHWNVIIDNTDDGNLANALKLRPFSVAQEYGALTKEDCLNVNVNVYENGDIVEIVSLCSSHGTHVASIASANFPDAPEKNGLAPGAQIISICIGDGRLGSMETGPGLYRAMTYIMQRKEKGLPVDLINMSYGEHSHWSNAGKIGEMISEVINKYGVTWVVSAGNAGPALSTVGSPPDIFMNSMIGIGAYVSPEMMMAMYSAREKLPGTTYTWTSRGPTMDGDRGVSICAPGGAITSVPKFTNRGTQLMNGTSMASPHACGALALLISGLKQGSIEFSPFFIKRAITNTAKYLNHVCPFAQGHGLLQVEPAFDHLLAFHKEEDVPIRFAVTCYSSSKGIHLRDFNDDKSVEVPVKIEPIFLNDVERTNEEKVGFNLRISLGCSAAWVKHPKHLDLMYSPRNFLVHVDPTGLEPGVHSAFVNAYDMKNPTKGPIFEIPITVIKSEKMRDEPRPAVEHSNVVFGPGEIKRHFIKVPKEATWASITVRSEEKAATGKFLLHTVQLLPKKSVQQVEQMKMFSLAEHEDWTYGFSVEGGYVLEVCLAKWWANLGSVKASYIVTFYGLSTGSKEIVFHGSDGYKRVDVRSALHSEEMQVEAKLKSLVQNYRPVESKIIALGERDTLPRNRTALELQLTYNFSLSKSSEITPNLTLLSDMLYESEFISQFWIAYNSHKQFVSCGDAFASRWPFKAEKDDYVLKAYVRHDQREVLDKLVDLPLTITSKLPSTVNVDAYGSVSQATIAGKKLSVVHVPKGASVPVFLTTPVVNEKLLKNPTVGYYLLGNVTLSKDDSRKKAETHTLKYVLNENPIKRDKAKASATKKESSLAETLIDTKISWLAKMDPYSEEATQLFESLKGEETAHQAQIRLARISSFNIDKKLDIDSAAQKAAPEVVDLANQIQELVKEEEILLFMGTKFDARQEANEARKDIEKNKAIFIEAMAKKGIALCAVGKVEAATEVLFRLLKFTEITDSKVITFAIMHAERLSHFARAIKLAIHSLEGKPNNLELEQKVIQYFDELDWSHCAKFARQSLPTRFPNEFEIY